MASVGHSTSIPLRNLVAKRQSQIAYLRRSHLPDINPETGLVDDRPYWLNTVQLAQEEINAHISDRRLIEGWFVLGQSMGKLLDLSSGPMLVNALAQLMEEFVYEFRSGIFGGMLSQLRGRNLAEKDEIINTEPVKPVIWKRDNKVVFQFLEKIKVPAGLDYCLVIHGVTSVLFLLYAKLLDPACANDKFERAIQALDTKIQTVVLQELTNVLTNITHEVLQKEFSQTTPDIMTLQGELYKTIGISRDDIAQMLILDGLRGGK